jgi:hypothetical protein
MNQPLKPPLSFKTKLKQTKTLDEKKNAKQKVDLSLNVKNNKFERLSQNFLQSIFLLQYVITNVIMSF